MTAAGEPTGEAGEFSRRTLLRLLSSGLAFAGAEACTRAPREKIVPYVDQPPEVTPGVAARYATSTALDGYSVGLIVRSNEGRPTKVEGNPLHPASLGATGLREQALVLALYDPCRARRIQSGGQPATWSRFVEEVTRARSSGQELHLLLPPTSSPLVVSTLGRVARRVPGARVHFFAPLSRRSSWEGARAAFGRVLEPRHDLRRADVVVALDADFLGQGPAMLADARHFAQRRRPAGPRGTMNRLYVVEAPLTVTGMNADHRLPVRAREVHSVAATLAAEVLAGAPLAPGAPAGGAWRPPSSPRFTAWARTVAADLRAHVGASLVLAGDGQPPAVHALAHAMNAALGNVGRTVVYQASPVLEAGEPSHDPAELARALDGGRVGALLVLGGNPVYDAPADLELERRLRSLSFTAYLGLYDNETAAACQWTVPAAHDLESWGDGRAFDGTVSLQQPLIAPLYDGRTVAEVLSAIADASPATAHELLLQSWRERMPEGQRDDLWNASLESGVVDSTAFEPVEVGVDWRAIARLPPPPAESEALEINFRPDARVYDGRFSNSGWLLELPDPVTKLTWGNAALLGPGTAARLGVKTQDLVDLQVRGRTVRAPVLVQTGHAEEAVTLPLGYGRRGAECLAEGVGVNAYPLRTAQAPTFDDATVRVAGGSAVLAFTQTSLSTHGRPVALTRTLAEYASDPGFAADQNRRTLTLYALVPSAPVQWGMTVDLSTCTGCSACVLACQAENNVPVVGKDGVLKSREMHWLRIDRYFEGDPRAPRAVVQPMMCQHCERAPCEYVCPVGATVHSADGLNEMVYNRCVGTRFCSNNCPYKVRRFNFFNYNLDKTPTEQMAMNPGVTVRARGVMEKCTYCVQRIRAAEITARREQRPIRDGEVTTACEQACASGAIVFGDIANPGSRVSAARRDPRLFAVLHELGTEPRTRYLARITNPNPALESS
jgi:molybdopterin-containing oxidoreductase family iron-sulfur binding subunit